MIGFGIKGAREFEKLLYQLGPNVSRRIGTRAAVDGAKVIAREAARLVHKRTGELESSITVVPIKSNEEREVGAAVGFLKPTGARAHFEEFGTANQPARPFLRPAADGKADAAIKESGQTLGKGIDREAKKLSKPIR